MTQLTAQPAAHLAPRPLAPSRRPEPNGLGYGMFLLVNLAYFLRPADFIPAMLNVEVYAYVIIACLFVSFPAVIEYLQPQKLERRPIDLCVLLLLPAVMLSHLINNDLDNAWKDGFAFWKILVYYLLFVSLVTTPGRIRGFIAVLAVGSAAVAVLGMCDFYKVIRLPRMLNAHGMEPVEDPTRMYGPGIFLDPNDVGLLLITSGLLLLAILSDKRLGPLRWLGLPLLGLFGFAFYLTGSRGQVLSLAAGLAVLFVLRYGVQRGVLLGLALSPLLATAFLARQADLSSHQDSGQTRIQLWNDGLVMFKANPIFGVGANRYAAEAGQVAHNSYLHAFGELGAFGGLLFLAAVALSLEGLYKLRVPYLRPGGGWLPREMADPDLGRLFPYVAAAAAAYAVGMFTLTENYMVMTYTMIGLASTVIANARVTPPVATTRFDLALLARMGVLSVGFLVVMYAIVRALFRA